MNTDFIKAIIETTFSVTFPYVSPLIFILFAMRVMYEIMVIVRNVAIED